MKSPRPSPLCTRAAFAALSLLLLACSVVAQDSKPSPLPPPEPPGGGGPGWTKPLRHPEGPFTTHEVMRRAVLTANPQPPQSGPPTEDAPSGVVRLRAILSYTGEVTNITVLKGLPGGLTEKAVEAAKLIKFTPAERDGRAVSQYVTLEYKFNVYQDESEVTKKVSITEQPQPIYTEEALANRVAGKVIVEAVFTKDGKVESPQVVEGLHYGLSERAVEAARRIKFKPAEVKGRKVSVLRRVEYVFSPDATGTQPSKH